jgi:glyoxylase-like metal-dependent hydrolase (beta-lactamase superfamily II)
LKVGTIEILPVIDGTHSVPLSRTFATFGAGPDGQDPEKAWEAHRYLLDDDGEIETSLGGFLIRGADQRMTLVDLGLGEHEVMGATAGGMLQSLAQLGVQPEDITDVVFTHLHIDHIGWASKNGEVVFPNATYRCAAADWEYFVTNVSDASAADDPNVARSHPVFELGRQLLLPASDRLETWSADGTILPGVDAICIPGHTPGSTILVVSDGSQRAMLLGDVVHCAVQLLDDEWNTFGDVDPIRAKQARNALVRELEGEDTPVAAAHFPGLQFGRILYGETPRRFSFMS